MTWSSLVDLRTRNHLFAHIRFHALRSIKSRMQVFPDPSNPLIHHVRTLPFHEHNVTALADPDIGRWICTFRNVEDLFVNTIGGDHQSTLTTGLVLKCSDTLESLTISHRTPSRLVTAFVISRRFTAVCERRRVWGTFGT